MLLAAALLTVNLTAHELPRVVPLAEAALGTQPISLTAVANPRERVPKTGPGGMLVRSVG